MAFRRRNFRRRRPGLGPMARRRRPSRKTMVRRRFRRANRPRAKILYQPAPDRCFTKLRYNQLLTLTSPVDGTTSSTWWQSSIFDPESAVGGHQPLWHDQWASFYTYYRVHGMKYTIRVTDLTSTAAAWSAIMHYPSYTNGTMPSSDLQTEMERRHCKGKAHLSWSGPGSTRTFKGYVSVPKVEGLSRTEFLGNESYWSTFGTNPSKMAYLALLLKGYSTSASINGYIQMTYYTEMWGRKEVAGS